MQLGDITVYTDSNGHRRVAVITGMNSDGTVDLAALTTTHENIRRSSREASPGAVYDPMIRESIMEPDGVTLESP